MHTLHFLAADVATRAGGASVSQVGRLQEARKSLETEVGFPIAASIGKDLRLLAYPRTRADRDRIAGISSWSGFPIEVRETPHAL